MIRRTTLATSIFLAAVTIRAGAIAPQGMNPEKLKAIPAAMQKFVDDKTIAGAVTLIARDGKIASLEAVGMSDLEKGTAMTKESVFWIASMTKPVTATAVLMLQDEGKLSVDDPVEKHLPEFKGLMLAAEKTPERVVLQKPARPVTIKDLLSHTSGLTSSLPTGGTALDTLTLKGAVIGYALSPLQFEPGSKWQYCNPGINTLGRIIEVVSGMAYPDFIQKRILAPLGMSQTTFWPNGSQLRRLAKSYKTKADNSGLEEVLIAYLTRPYSDRSRMALPAGGLFSTAGDYGRFLMMIANEGKHGNKQIVSAEAIKLMSTIHTGDLKAGFTEGTGFGLGWNVVREPQGVTASLSPGSFGHGGAHGTQGWIDPVKKMVFILMIQRTGANSDASEIRKALHDTAVAAIDGQ